MPTKLYTTRQQHDFGKHDPTEYQQDINMNDARMLTPPSHVFTTEDFDAIGGNRVNNCPVNVQHEGKDGSILWLIGPGDNAKRTKYILGRLEKLDPLLTKRLKLIQVNTPLHKILIPKPKTKATQMVEPDYERTLRNQLSGLLPSASVVVINDFSILAATLASSTGHGNKKTMAAFRGSVYVNNLFNGIPAVVVEDASKCYVSSFGTLGKNENTKAQNVQYFDYDIQKVRRLFYQPQRCASTFDDKFQIIQSTYLSEHTQTSGINSYAISQNNKLQPWFNNWAYLDWLKRQSLLALDFETSMSFITCLSITGIEDHDPSSLQTWVLPHINPTRFDNQHMTFASFMSLLGETLQTPTPKIWHNGNYDLHYALKYNLPPRGLNHDSMLAWHSLNPQMPQSLAAIASIFNDDYYYWKDEIKGGADEKKTNLKYAVPTTRNGLLTYLRYAGLDTHHTMQAFLSIMAEVGANPRALYNYAKEYSLMRGPLLATNYRGINVDRAEYNKLLDKERDATATGLNNLREASSGLVQRGTDTECINWLYKTLGAPVPPKKAGRKSAFSVDQKQLILVAEAHPIFERAIDTVRGHREHQKRVTMYSPPNKDKTGGLKLRQLGLNQYRFHHSYALGPYTGRLACRGSAFFDGTNSQNIPAKMRSFLCADSGKVLIDIDYSQADLYHFAIACGDTNMINTVFDDRDTHAAHVEMILQVPYDEVMAGKRANDPFVVDPIKGVRQIIKKLSHGGNYGMSPPTAYVNAGRESLEAAADYLGKNRSKWTRANYYDFCEELLVPYFDAYPRQKIWRKELVQECVANEGYMTCFGGLTCYFDDYKRPKEQQSLMRALLAFFGQGGTAGMINQAMLDLYYRADEEGNANSIAIQDPRKTFLNANNIELLLQTHDSLTYQTSVETLVRKNIVNKLLTTMELQCNFNGRDYVVPCEVNVGYRWSKAMPEIKRDASDTQLVCSLLENYAEEGLI